MPAALGINVAYGADPAAIAATGARFIRVVYRDNLPLRPWINDLKNRGVECLFVFDSSPESLGDNEGQWAGRLTVARSNYGDLVKLMQPGNEPDGNGIASWTMDHARVNRLLIAARTVFPAGDYILIAPGMVTGQPSWLKGLRLDLVDQIDAHAYAKEADTPALRDMLNGYLSYGKPLACLEYDSRARGLSAYLRFFPGIVAATVFCWDDGQTESTEHIRLGLLQNKAAMDDFVAAATMPDPHPPEKPPMPTFDVGPAVLARMKQYKDEPSSSEVYFHDSRGRMAWSITQGMSNREYKYNPVTRFVLVTDPSSWVSEDELLQPPAPPPSGAAHWFTAVQIAGTLGASLTNVTAYWPVVAAALDELSINDRPTTIAALATIGVEVGSFAPIEEYRNPDGSIPDYWNGYGGGANFHGRGFIQLTHNYNYKYYGDALGVDLLRNPGLALDPTIAARVLALYFKEYSIPRLAAIPDWFKVRVAVNGSPPNGWQRFADLVDALEAL